MVGVAYIQLKTWAKKKRTTLTLVLKRNTFASTKGKVNYYST